MCSNINLIVKPSNNCNLDCSYCFQSHSKVTLGIDKILKIVGLASKEYDTVNLIIHGGEPLLMGYSYYESLFKSLDWTNLTVSIQTNGTLLTKPLLELFNLYEVAISMSYDGQGSVRGDKVSCVESWLSTENISCVTVLHSGNIKCSIQLYEELKEIVTADSLCMNLVYAGGSNELLLSESHVDSYLNLVEYILVDTSESAKLERNITEMLISILGHKSTLCTRCCGYNWVTLDATGFLYGCDRLTDTYSDIHIDSIESIEDMFQSETYLLHVHELMNKHSQCKSCNYTNYCVNKCRFSDSLACDITKSLIVRLVEMLNNNEIKNTQYRRMIYGDA